MNEKYVIEANNISKEYKGFNLENVSFSLPKGYIMGLIGPNGSGKTTTIKTILNLVKADSGEIYVFGKRNLENREVILQNVGTVFDSHSFLPEWTADEINKIYSWFYTQWSQETFEKNLDRFSINKHKMVKDMSKGTQMKLMIACALSYDAKLLILDEPTSGLDPVARDGLIDILGRYVEDGEHSVLFSTHITSDLEKIADYITFLLNGKLIYSGDKNSLQEKYLKIKGNYKKLNNENKQYIIGMRLYEDNFEGLIETSQSNMFNGFYTENTAIEDILVFMGRNKDERNMEYC